MLDTVSLFSCAVYIKSLDPPPLLPPKSSSQRYQRLMRLQVYRLLILTCLFLRINLTLATPLGVGSPQLQNLRVRHDDDHMSVSEEGPLEHINETQILQDHDPDPVAYYEYDYENATPDLSPEVLEGFDIETRHGGLMLFHAFTMVISYLFILPICGFQS